MRTVKDIWQKFEKVEELGQGAFGSVWLVKNKDDGKSYALKFIPIWRTTFTEDIIKLFEEIMQECKLDFQIYDVFQIVDEEDEEDVVVVQMTAINGKTIERISGSIVGFGGPNFSETNISPKQLFSIIETLVRQIDCMHAKGVVHRDIKPDNIVVHDMDKSVLVDFDLACFSGKTDLKILSCDTMTSGFYVYYSPEIRFFDSVQTKKSDIWAMGATLWYLLFGEHFFIPARYPDPFKSVLEEKINSRCFINDSFGNFVKSILIFDPEKRPTTAQLLKDLSKMNDILFTVPKVGKYRKGISTDKVDEFVKKSQTYLESNEFDYSDVTYIMSGRYGLSDSLTFLHFWPLEIQIWKLFFYMISKKQEDWTEGEVHDFSRLIPRRPDDEKLSLSTKNAFTSLLYLYIKLVPDYLSEEDIQMIYERIILALFRQNLSKIYKPPDDLLESIIQWRGKSGKRIQLDMDFAQFVSLPETAKKSDMQLDVKYLLRAHSALCLKKAAKLTKSERKKLIGIEKMAPDKKKKCSILAAHLFCKDIEKNFSAQELKKLVKTMWSELSDVEFPKKTKKSKEKEFYCKLLNDMYYYVQSRYT